MRGQLGELGDEVDRGLVHEAQDVAVHLRSSRVRAVSSGAYSMKCLDVNNWSKDVRELFLN